MKLLPEHVGWHCEADDAGMRVVGVITGLGAGRSRQSAAHPWDEGPVYATVCIPPVKMPPGYVGSWSNSTACVVVNEDRVLRVWKGD